MKKTTIGVLGVGLFGSAVARTLAQNGVDVIAMDKNMDHVEEILDDVEFAVQGDFTKIDQLIEAGIDECSEVVIASAEKLEDSILAIINLQKLKIPAITVKTKNKDYQEVLSKVGATRVILPEAEMGVQTALTLANPSVHELIKLDNTYNVIEFPYRDNWVGKTIEEIDFRKQYHINIIAIKSIQNDNFTIEFKPRYVVNKGDIFLGVTTDNGIKNLLD